MKDAVETAVAENAGMELTSGNLDHATEPFGLFSEWLAEAEALEPNDPNAMALATVDAAGLPDIRMVLLKAFDRAGFVFYTNLLSAKGREIAATPKAALLLHWKSLRRQVRIRGNVERVTDAEADAYFRTRSRLSQIGAWSSRQSEMLESRRVFAAAVSETLVKYEGVNDIPRPPHWSGYRVVPREIEFWRDGAARLHHRIRFTRAAGEGWDKVMLYP
jgi:pyridoxamine 5'-phosphate oxidase